MTGQGNHPNEQSIKIPSPEVLDEPAVTGFIQGYPNKQNLKTHTLTTQLCVCVV